MARFEAAGSLRSPAASYWVRARLNSGALGGLCPPRSCTTSAVALAYSSRSEDSSIRCNTARYRSITSGRDHLGASGRDPIMGGARLSGALLYCSYLELHVIGAERRPQLR